MIMEIYLKLRDTSCVLKSVMYEMTALSYSILEYTNCNHVQITLIFYQHLETFTPSSLSLRSKTPARFFTWPLFIKLTFLYQKKPLNGTFSLITFALPHTTVIYDQASIFISHYFVNFLIPEPINLIKRKSTIDIS